MKLKAKDIKVGMHLTHGEVIRSDSHLNAWVVITTDGFDRKERYLSPDSELEVTAVLGKHLRVGMNLLEHGEVKRAGSLSDVVSVESTRGEFFRVGVWEVVTLTPVPPKREAPLDPKKHLLWAIDNKDWAQARAALTEMEKQA